MVDFLLQNQSPAPDDTGVGLGASVSVDFVYTIAADFNEATLPIESYYVVEDISSQVDGVAIVFTLAHPYIGGTVKLWWDGVQEHAAETSPAVATITLAAPPGSGTKLFVSYIKRILVITVDLNSVEITVAGEVAFTNGAWESGYDGTISPLLGGYRFTITDHPDFDPASLVEIDVVGESTTAQFSPTLSWSFSTTLLAVTDVSQPTVEDDGGHELTLSGVFDDSLPVQVFVVLGLVEIPCYSGISGAGNDCKVRTDGSVMFVTPPLVVGTTYDIKAGQGPDVSTLPACLTAVARNWKSRTFTLRGLFPPWYKTGPRDLDTTDLLT